MLYCSHILTLFLIFQKNVWSTGNLLILILIIVKVITSNKKLKTMNWPDFCIQFNPNCDKYNYQHMLNNLNLSRYCYILTILDQKIKIISINSREGVSDLSGGGKCLFVPLYGISYRNIHHIYQFQSINFIYQQIFQRQQIFKLMNL